MNPVLNLLGRVLFVAIFIMSALGKVMDFGGTSAYMANAGFPFPAVFLVGAIFLLLFGSVTILLNRKVKLGAAALILFLIVATAMFHTELSVKSELINFMKNLSLIGALFFMSSKAEE